MANRNSSTNATSSTTQGKEKLFSLHLLYGEFRVTQTEAYDHTSMRAKQLNALMLLMTGDGFDVYEGLGEKAKHELMWLAQQLADEVSTMIPIISAADMGGKEELEVKA